jgi:hypothetical protein
MPCCLCGSSDHSTSRCPWRKHARTPESGMLNDTSSVQSPLCGKVCGGSLLGSVERPEILRRPAVADIGNPASKRLLPRNAEKSRLVVRKRRAPILSIFSRRNVSEIGDAVIRFVAIDMVDLLLRPFAVYVQPRQTVRPPNTPVDVDEDVTTGAFDGPCSAVLPAAFPSGSPKEFAGFRVVVEKFAQSLRGKIDLSHEAVLSLIGQSLRRVDSASQARLFSPVFRYSARGFACSPF